MPDSIIPVIDSLPTIEEKIRARLIWNRSLPVAANVAIIEFNRVEEKLFRERVGEEWWRNVAWLARELNMAARMIKGEDVDKVLNERKEPEMGKVGMSEWRGKQPETQTHDETRGKTQGSDIPTPGRLAEAAEAETQAHEETGVKAQEAETRTLDLLAEAATLRGQSGEVSATTAAKSATGKDKQDEPDSKDEATEAAFRLAIPCNW